MLDIAHLLTSHVDRLSFVSRTASKHIQRRLHEDDVKMCRVQSRLEVCDCRWTTDAVGGRAGRWLSETVKEGGSLYVLKANFTCHIIFQENFAAWLDARNNFIGSRW